MPIRERAHDLQPRGGAPRGVAHERACAAHDDLRQMPAVRLVCGPGRHHLDRVRSDREHMRDGRPDRRVRRGEVHRDDAAPLRRDGDGRAEAALGEELDRAPDRPLAPHRVGGQGGRVRARARDPGVGRIVGDRERVAVHGDDMPGAALELIREHLGEARAGRGRVPVPLRPRDPVALRAALDGRRGGLGGRRGGRAAQAVDDAHRSVLPVHVVGVEGGRIAALGTVRAGARDGLDEPLHGREILAAGALRVGHRSEAKIAV